MQKPKNSKPAKKQGDHKKPAPKGDAKSGGKPAHKSSGKPAHKGDAKGGGKPAHKRDAKGGDKPKGGKSRGRGKSTGEPSKRYKSPGDNVYEMRVKAIKQRLDELRQYKRILEAEGQEPDVDDKRVESELIIRLLRLEKQHAGPQAPKKPNPKAADGKKADFKRRKPRRDRQEKRTPKPDED